MDEPALLRQPHLTIVSGEPDASLQQIAQIVTHSVTVDGRVELGALLGRLLAEAEQGAQVTPKTLDLIGHTRSSASLLALGAWVIDAANPETAEFFHGLAADAVLPRLGVTALRLLGCSSAGTAEGRATLCRLADLLGLEVYGTSQLLHAAHYDAAGLRDCWSFLLVAANEPGTSHEAGETPPGSSAPRVLDLDALPAVALGARVEAWPRRIASAEAASRILQLVHHRQGAAMPGPPAAPAYELALPSRSPGVYHVAHVVLGGAFLRFYPDGMDAAGIVFPVADADTLRRVVAALPSGPEVSD